MKVKINNFKMSCKRVKNNFKQSLEDDKNFNENIKFHLDHKETL